MIIKFYVALSEERNGFHGYAYMASDLKLMINGDNF